MVLHSALRLMRLAYTIILLSATDTRKCRALIMVSFLHLGQNKGNARNSVCLTSCNLVFAPQQGQNTHCLSSIISAASFREFHMEGLVEQPHMPFQHIHDFRLLFRVAVAFPQQNQDGTVVHHGK